MSFTLKVKLPSQHDFEHWTCSRHNEYLVWGEEKLNYTQLIHRLQSLTQELTDTVENHTLLKAIAIYAQIGSQWLKTTEPVTIVYA